MAFRIWNFNNLFFIIKFPFFPQNAGLPLKTMKALCQEQCTQFIDSLSLNTQQWDKAFVTIVITWIIINVLHNNRWVIRQQCYSAQLLVWNVMHIHIDRHHHGLHVFERLAMADSKYLLMLTSVLNANTQEQQLDYSRRIDCLMAPLNGRAARIDCTQICTEAKELVESLQWRKFRGMFTDPLDVEMMLLILSQCKRIMDMRHSHE